MTQREMSRGYRNCNPGNIRRGADRFRGEYRDCEDAQFRQFESMDWGYRAIYLLIHNYGELYGIHSLEGIISRWAPASENDTAHYIDVVARRLKIEPSGYIDTLDRGVMMRLAGAISHIENGVKANPEELAAGWELFVDGVL